MDKLGQIKTRSGIMILLFSLTTLVLVICLLVRASLLKSQMLEFDDPTPISASLRGSILDRNGTFLAMDSRKTVSTQDGKTYQMRIRTYPYNIPSLRRTLGETDASANGLSGIEKLCNTYLVSSENKDKSMSEGVTLTLDISLIQRINSSLKGVRGNVHTIIMDKDTGDVLVVWDNEGEGIKFDDDIYSLNDLTSSPLLRAFLASAMAEIDRTRIFDYKCLGTGKCDHSHGSITVDRISECPSAIDEMIRAYSDEEISSMLEGFSLIDFKITSFMDAATNGIFMQSHPKMHILQGYDDGSQKELSGVSTREITISESVSKYLARQLLIASPNEKIFTVKDKYTVYVSSPSTSINEVMYAIKNILENY